MSRNPSKKGPRKSSAPGFASAEVPLYYQLRAILREQILSGAYRPGDQLPTEAEIVGSYGVSRITVRQALRSLEEEKLIRREAGRGTFVTDRPAEQDILQMDGSLDDLISMGLATSVQLLELEERGATLRDANIFGTEVGAPMVQCTRLRFYHDKPYSHIVNRMPKSVADRLERSDWQTGGILAALERQGIALGDADQSVRATLADPVMAGALDVDIGAPLLLVDRIVLDADGHPVERVHTHYRSDIYSLNVHLTRDPSSARSAEGWTLKGAPSRR